MRSRLAFHDWPAAVYAIGDVHGCLRQLLALEEAIVADARNFDGEKWIVTLGDHIDRGPDSAGVVAHVSKGAPAGFKRFALAGNHEALALDYFESPDPDDNWLSQGGIETLHSFGVDPLTESSASRQPDELVPKDFLAFLATLPICLSLPGWLFVHAGIRPGIPLHAQTEFDMLWIRGPFLNAQLTGGLRIVHGHTPGRDVVITPHRIDVDTHCYATGRLSAVRVTPDGGTSVLSVSL